MATNILIQVQYHNEAAAFEALEEIMWPNGPVCPHCGALDRLGRLENQRTKASKKHPEGRLIHGLWKCYHCKQKFTVRVGTIFEDSHLELHKWLQAAFLMCSSKKGVSTNQLHRTLGCTLKTAWFVSMRLREAMAPHGKQEPMGGFGRVIEADETYIGKRRGRPSGPSTFVSGFGWVSPPRIQSERKIVSLVERGGSVRSFHVDRVDGATVKEIILKNADRQSELMTDEAPIYIRTGWQYLSHQAVNHSEEEWVRGFAHTNTIEGYFSIFKRGMKGVYQHCKEKHLHRYLAEFDFRYSNRIALGVDDSARTVRALQGAKGKRLTYGPARETGTAAN
jgi:transposase-like protein